MYLTHSHKYSIMVYGVKYMFTDVNIIRVGGGDRQPLHFKKIVTDEGEALSDCFFNDCALPIPGYIPVKMKNEDTATYYINSDKIFAIVVADEEQDNMRTDIIKPKEYKEKG